MPKVHFMYRVKSGCPQPNPEPKGNFMGIVPQVLWHVPLIGRTRGTAMRVGVRERKMKVFMRRDEVIVGYCGLLWVTLVKGERKSERVSKESF